MRMKNVILQEDITFVEERLKQFEMKTGCELLLVVAKSSDPYPAASWRFGVIGGFVISMFFGYFYEFHHAWAWPLCCLIFTLLMTYVGHFDWIKKFALSDWEVDRECQEKAFELFHTLGTTKVSHKVTAMIMISVLEKKITVLVDEKLKTQITQEELGELISIMQTHFRKGNMGLGLSQSIQSLEDKILKDFGGKVSDASPSELKDFIHFI